LNQSPEYEELRRQAFAHPDPIDLCCSNPGDVGLGPHRLLPQAMATNYRPDARGRIEARRAIAKDRHALLGSEDVLLTASTSEAYFFLLLALCDPGDTILVPAPSYPLFGQLAQLASVQIQNYRLAYDGAWYIDQASLPSAAEILETRIRLIMAVSPNNPSGNVLKLDELAALRSLGLPLIVDEVFRLYARGHDLGADPLLSSDEGPLTVVLDGLSKRGLSPGLKLAWLIARGPRSKELWDRLEWVSDSFLSAGSLVQASLPHLLEHESALRRPALDRIDANLTLLSQTLQGSALTLLSSDGGWSAMLRYPNTCSEHERWQRACQQGLWLHPGHLFDLEQENIFIVSLLTPSAEFRRGIERLLLL